MDRRAQNPPAVLESASELLSGYDVLFCDVWGVLHNGARAYPDAGEALARFRKRGGVVVLVSNAPMTFDSVADLLAVRGVRRDAWDTIVSSGELTRARIAEQGISRVHHIGPDVYLGIFAGLGVKRVALERAEAIICTGVIDDRNETGESYRPLLEDGRKLGLPLICANPDLVVEVGDLILPCAGAIAVVYEEMGGDVYWAGKPHRSAYLAAHAQAEKLAGRTVDRSRILAIGDAVRTDVAGAQGYGVASVLIAHGIHREELMLSGRLDPRRLEQFLAKAPARPLAVMSALRV